MKRKIKKTFKVFSVVQPDDHIVEQNLVAQTTRVDMAMNYLHRGYGVYAHNSVSLNRKKALKLPPLPF